MNNLLQKFKTVHQELQVVLQSQAPDVDILQSKITQYIALMVEEKKQSQLQEQMFDYFCQFNGVAILAKLLKVDSLLAIKSYSLLFINLRAQIWISYILCQPFLTEAIETRCDADEQEWTQYFVSFLKSLSIRLNNSQITLFFNKKCCRFPLVYQAMKFFNHPDFMVRTSVMNIILQLLKINQLKTRQYFSRFPFTSYLITFSCEVYQLIQSHHHKLKNQQKIQPKYVQNYGVDLSDYLYYFNDLTQFGTSIAAEVIQNSFIHYLVIPTFKWLLADDPFSIKHALLLCQQFLKIIKSQSLNDTVVTLLFGPKIRSAILQVIESQVIYFPKVFQQQFKPNQFYWSRYQTQITGHCLDIFDGLLNFDVDYQNNQHQISQQFTEQINKMSNFIDYNLLKGCRTKTAYPECVIDSQDNSLIDNPFLGKLLKLMSEENNENIYQINSILSGIIKDSKVSKNIMDYCGICRLQHQQIQSKQQQPQNSQQKVVIMLPELKETLLGIWQHKFQRINWRQTRFSTIQSIINMLLLSKQPFTIQFQQLILSNYRDIAKLLKQFVNIENITIIVQNFHSTYQKIQSQFNKKEIQRQAVFVTLFLPQQKWNQAYSYFALPSENNSLVLHYLQHFVLYRCFISHYFNLHYQAEYYDFCREYSINFDYITKRWKKGQKYRDFKKNMIPCLLAGKKGLIIQDNLNLVLAEIDPQSIFCKLILNQSWKKVTTEMSKDEPSVIIVQCVGQVRQKYTISFEDQVRSNTTLVKFSDLKWQRYQEELSYISKFIIRSLEQ